MSIFKRTIKSGGFSHREYMSKFANEQSVLDWIEEMGGLVTLEIENQVSNMWKRMQQHPNPLFDYEITVSAKKDQTVAKIYFFRKVHPSQEGE